MRIVLVDSSRVVVKILADLLRGQGHEVFGFVDGEAALNKLRDDDEIDVLLTSLELPTLSGFELCWESRLLPRQRALYILAMSSRAGHERLAEALDSGADDFVGKPPHPDELFARLRAAERLAVAQRELFRLATRDASTGLLNRRAFYDAARAAGGGQARRGAVGVIVLDIDHFKRTNEVWGHDACDQVLEHLGRILAEAPGIVGRIGGEEFAVVMREGSADDLWALAEDLRLRILDRPLVTHLGDIVVSVSAGTAMAEPDETIDATLRRADLALGMAKRAGRNRTVAADGPARHAVAAAG